MDFDFKVQNIIGGSGGEKIVRQSNRNIDVKKEEKQRKGEKI